MSDETSTVQEMKDSVRRFCEVRDWDQFHSPMNLAVGITTESVELLDIFRFKSDSEISDIMNDPVKRNDVCEELSDVLYFVLRFAQMNDIDLSDNLARKIEKNGIRYPVDRSKGSNKKYNEL